MAKVSVSRYVRNVGKSVTYAAIESMSSSASTIKSYIESIDEGYKKIYTTISEKLEKRDNKSFKDKIKNSEIYKTVDEGFKNLKEDIRTGNWYNKDREDSSLGSAFGFDDDFDSLYSDSSSSNSRASSSTNEDDDNDKFSMSPESMISAAYQSQATTKTGEFIVKGNKANTQILISHLTDINTRVIGSIGTVYNEVKTTNKFLNENISKYLNEASGYHKQSLEQLKTIATSIDTLVSIQNSLYRPEKKYNYNKRDQSVDDIITSSGLDIKEYVKLIRSNINDIFPIDMILDMTNMMKEMSGDSTGGLKSIATNPIGSALTAALKVVFKKTSEKMAELDDSISNFLPNLFSKLDKNSSNGVISNIASIFGLKVKSDRENINVSKYEKGPIPFDGITRKTIVEVIPGYLARIESALTGTEERYFDLNKAKWIYANKIARNFANEKNDTIAYANSDINSDLSDMYYDIRSKGGEKQEKALRKKIDNMIKIIYKDNGKFVGNIEKGWKYYGFNSPDEFRMIKNALSRRTINNIAINNMRAREEIINKYKNFEENPGLYSTLFNDTFTNADEEDNRWNRSAKNPSNFKKSVAGPLLTTQDSYGKNVFYYLREILNSINNNWRKGRGGRRNRPNPKGPQNGPGVSPSSREGSSDSSNEDSDSDDDPGLDWEYLKKRQEEEKEEKGEEIKEGTAVSKFIKKIFGDKGEEAYNKVLEVFNSPVKFVTKLIEKADNALFNLMFGDGEYYDSEGNRLDSAFDYMMDRIAVGIENMTNRITDFFKEKVYKKYLQPFFEKYIKPITTEAKNIVTKGARYVKDTASDLFSNIKKKFSRQAENMENGGVSSEEDFRNEADDSGINTSAYGRVATKRGLTMISPGEIIIPATFDKNKQNKMEKEERKDRDKIADMIALNAKGNMGEKNEENLKRLKTFFSNIVGDSYDHTSKILAGGLVGGGAGLLLGNPFLGAIAGSALSIINNSETVKKVLFGEEVTNEDGTKSRAGGFIPKKVIDVFTKALPDMGKFGLVGGIAGIFTGFGLVGGAGIGIAASLLKNNEKFNNFLFGENGLLEKEGVKKVRNILSKATPNMAIGAGIGLLAGPFGLLGNTIVGASIGLLTTTDKFQKFMFGDPEHPERNSVMKVINNAIILPGKEKIKEMLDSFKEYTEKYVLDPMKRFWDPFKQGIKNSIDSITEGIKDAAKDMLENSLGLPAADFLQERIFKPLGKVINLLVKNPVKLLGMAFGAVVTSPFRLLGNIGDRMRMGQIRKGKAYDMSAEERLNFREDYADNRLINRFLFGNKKKGTTGLTGFIDRRKIIPAPIKNALLGGLHSIENNKSRIGGGLLGFWKDRNYDQDVTLSNMSNEELDTILSGAGSIINSEEELQERIGKVKGKMSNNLSELFNKRDTTGKNLYDKIGWKDASKIMEMAGSGDLGVIDYINNMSMDNMSKSDQSAIKNSIISSITNADGVNDLRMINSLRASLSNKREDSSEIEKQISEAFGKDIKGKKGFRSVYKSVEAELNARRKGEFIEPEKTPEEMTNDTINDGFESVKNSFEKVTDNLNSIKETIVNSAKEICYTINPSLRKDDETTSNPIAEAVDNIKNTEENDALHRDDVFDQKTGNFVPRNENDTEYKENEKERQDIENKEKDNAEDEKQKRNKLSEYIDVIIGKKKEREKSKTGLAGVLGKIVSFRNNLGNEDTMVGKVFKIGKTVVKGALFVSLLGYASEFIKTTIWPKIQTLLFGSVKEDGSRSGGLLGGLKKLFVGEDGKSGLLGSIFGWFGDKFNSIAKWYNDHGGLSGLLVGAIEKIIVGQGYAIENIVAPLASLMIQALPSVIVGLVKGLLSGVKALLTGNSLSNKKLSANSGSSDLNISGIVNNIENTRTKTNNTLKSIMDNSNSSKDGTLSSNLTSIEKINKSSASSSSAINWTSELGISSGTYYNSKGEVVTSNDTTKAGLLWTRQHTNEIVTDEDGNIANDYYVWNTDESGASKIVKATATGFRNGLAGWGKDALSTALSKVSISPVGKKLTTKAITGAVQTGAKAIGSVTSVGWNAGTKTASGITNFIKNSAENVVANGTTTASTNAFTSLFKKLFGYIATSKIGQIIVSGFTKGAGTAFLQNALNNCAEKLAKHCATKLLGKAATKVASLLANATPIGIALALVDFLWGMSHAETILGVAKGGYDVNFGLRCICGLLNLLSNRFTLGLVPPSFILDLFIDAILPGFGVDVSELTNARSTYNEVLNAWNKAHPEETYDNLEDFNKRSNAGFLTRLSTSLKNIVGIKDKEVEKVMADAGITTSSSYYTASNVSKTSNVGYGRHLYQENPYIAGMKYGNSTIGKAGCAPVAATNALRNITGHGDLSHAAAYAEANGMVSPDGGTSMNYFNSYFRDNGLSTTNTNDPKDVINAVKNGQQAILYGQDGTNINSPFGTTPHFITATGLDSRGNVIVEDPDLPSSSIAYRPGQIAKSMKSSVIIDNTSLVGKGSDSTTTSNGGLVYSGGGGTFGTATDTTTDTSGQGTANTFFSSLTNLGTSMMKKVYGGLFDAIYGDGSESTADISSTHVSSSGRTHGGSGGTFGTSTSGGGGTTTGTSGVSRSSASTAADYDLSDKSDNSITGSTNEEKIWNYLRSKGYSAAGTAGIMGNLRMESNYTPYIVEGSQLSALGYPGGNGKTVYDRSKEFTADVQSGKFSKDKFINTYFGYGLPQFTYNTWKQQLYENTVEKDKKIDSISNQLDYLTATFKKYCSPLNTRLKNSTNAEESALDVFRSYEMPNWKEVTQYTYDNERKQYAADVYNRLAIGKGRATTGLAQQSIDQYKNDSDTMANNVTVTNSNSVDYITFLNTIVEILLKISTNTEVLDKILGILSDNFGINIDKSDIDTASQKTKLQGKAALNELVRRSTGNNTNLSKLLNNQDTEYIISAMSSLAKE